jgi:hypothetical protein
MADTAMVLAAWTDTAALEITIAPTDTVLVAEIEKEGSKEPLE